MNAQKVELNLLNQEMESLRPTLKILREGEREEADGLTKKIVRRHREIYVPRALEMTRRIRSLKTMVDQSQNSEMEDRRAKYAEFLKAQGIQLTESQQANG